jgi:hypothetical protein
LKILMIWGVSIRAVNTYSMIEGSMFNKIETLISYIAMYVGLLLIIIGGLYSIIRFTMLITGLLK